MAVHFDLPHSFAQALELAQKILSRNRKIIRHNLAQTEAEQIIVAAYREILNKELSRAELYTRLNDRLLEPVAEKIMLYALARAEGKPLQYVLGYQYFSEHEYLVTSDVLIPRPETEILLRAAFEKLDALQPGLGLEIGSGSGILSIELLHRFKHLRMKASEKSEGAFRITTKNAERILGAGAHRLAQIQVSDALSVLMAFGSEKADFLIANPPYLSTDDEIDEETLAHEPSLALFPGGDIHQDPLFFYREISEHAATVLKPGAPIFLEIPHTRATAIRALFEQQKYRVEMRRDLNNYERVLIFQSTLARVE